MNSRQAWKTVNRHRKELDDIPLITRAEEEFPGYEPLAHKNVHIFHADRNEAGAFKWRGALVGAYALARAGAEHFVVPSAGNHARGAAIAARILNREVTIVVPTTAPEAKREGIRKLWTGEGAKLTVIEYGESFDESLAYARQFEQDNPDAAMLHPYDDMNVILGQGTIVRDILAQQPETTRIALANGGGGLQAGTTMTLEDIGRPEVEVVAVQAYGSDSLERSIAAGEVVPASNNNSRFGGSNVRFTGNIALKTATNYPGELKILTASNRDVDEVTAKHQKYAESNPDAIPFEPTSLVAFAAAKQLDLSEGHTVFIGTGHNEYPFH